MYIYVHIFNACGRLGKTLQDAEKQIMFHALEQMEQDSVAYLVLAVQMLKEVNLAASGTCAFLVEGNLKKTFLYKLILKVNANIFKRNQ